MLKFARLGVLIVSVALLGVLLAACANGGSADEETKEDAWGTAQGLSSSADLEETASGGEREPIPVPVLGATPAPAPPPNPAPALSAPPIKQVDVVSFGALETAQRQVVSTASVSIEVEDVQGAVGKVRAMAEGLGGFVEQLSAAGNEKRQRATVTLRVPQDQFSAALERIEALGELLGESVGSEDVTERFIDLEARLKSSLREEQSLLSLLEKTETVTDILTIERELSRVRSEIERFQGQKNFLERRVELSTITVSLSPPEARATNPPSASVTVAVSDVGRSVDDTKALVAGLSGELGRVFVSVREGAQRAEVAFKVLARDFPRALAAIEGQGKVKTKEVREGVLTGQDAAREPDAPISVTFIERVESSSTGLMVAIAAPTGGVALAVVLGALFFVTYRVGRRRGGRA